MLEYIRDWKNYSAAAVIGCLVRGAVYHFFPFVNPILEGMLVIWPLILIIDGILHRQFHPDRIQWLLLGFLAAALISTVINLDSIQSWEHGDPAESFRSLFYGLSAVLILYGFSSHRPETDAVLFLNRLFLVIWGYIVLLSAGSVVLFVLYRMGIDLPGGFGGASQIFTYGHMGEETRFCGLFGYSNAGGNLCALAAPLAYYLTEQKKLSGWLAAGSAALLAYTIYLLDVRTSMVALLLCAVMIGWRILEKKAGTGKAVVISAVTLAVLAGVAGYLKQETILQYWAQYQEDPRKTIIFLTTGRSEYWELAVQGFLTKPLLGYGWLNNTYIGFYFDNHNLFFNILLWTGAVGTILFFTAFILLVVKVCRADMHHRYGLLLVLAAVFVQAMLDRAIMGTANASAETMVFWLVSGMLVFGKTKAGKHS